MAEIALAVVLLVTSGLMVRSLGHLFDAQVGYRAGRRAHGARSRCRRRASRISRSVPLWDEVIQRVSSDSGRDECRGRQLRAGR